MNYWYSPFPLDIESSNFLSSLGIRQTKDTLELKTKNCFLIYRAPHEILYNWKNQESKLESPYYSLKESYKQLLYLNEINKIKLIPLRVLRVLDKNDLNNFPLINKLSKEKVSLVSKSDIQLDPLLALITYKLIETQPEIIDFYLDIELKADLAGIEDDSNYLSFLKNAVCINDLLFKSWINSSDILKSKMKDAKFEIEAEKKKSFILNEKIIDLNKTYEAEKEKSIKLNQTILDLNKTYEAEKKRSSELNQTIVDLNKTYEAEKTKSSELNQTIEKLNYKIESSEKIIKNEQGNIEILNQQISESIKQLEETKSKIKSDSLKNQNKITTYKEDKDIAILQLQQIQEELENYYFRNKNFNELVIAQNDQLNRAKNILSRLTFHLSCNITKKNIKSVDVEVLPKLQIFENK